MSAPIDSVFDRNLRYFRKVARQFEPQSVIEDEDEGLFEFSEEDIYGTLMGSRGPTRLLGYYSRYAVEVALERYGILHAVRDAGYRGVTVDIELGHPTGELVRVTSADERKDLLMEVVLREDREFAPFRLLYVEWLLMQNPRRLPKVGRPLLPGQEHPGFGALENVVGMLLMTCERLGLMASRFRPRTITSQRSRVRGCASRILCWRLIIWRPAMRWRVCHWSSQREKWRKVGCFTQTLGSLTSGVSELMVLPVSEACKEAFHGREYMSAMEGAARGVKMVLSTAEELTSKE